MSNKLIINVTINLLVLFYHHYHAYNFQECVVCLAVVFI